MGQVFGTANNSHRAQVLYMKTPDLSRASSESQVPELVSEIGRHQYAGVVSIGPVGVGKSSNLNTIASFMSNRLEQQAGAGTGTSSLTHESLAHMISYQGRPVKWKWMDTPGDLFTDLVEQWKRTKLPDDVEEHLSMEGYEQQLQDKLITPLQQHHIGCVMAFLSAQELHANTMKQEMPGGERLRVAPNSRLSFHLQVLKDLYRRLVHENMRMVCVLTKADLVDAEIEKSVAAVQCSQDVHLLRQCTAQATGMPINQVHPVVNLIREFDPQDNLPLGHLALFNVRCALSAARHFEDGPPPPSPVNAGAMEWDTLTFPSRITSEDGMSGRSHPVHRNQEGEISARTAADDVISTVASSAMTDI